MLSQMKRAARRLIHVLEPEARAVLAESRSTPPIFEVMPAGWRTAAFDDSIRGWDVGSVADANEAKWTSFCQCIEGTAPLGVAHEAKEMRNDHLTAHNLNIAFGYVLALAASGRNHISLLDWGGGLGHYGKFAQALLPGVRVDYYCKDVQAMVERGRRCHTEAIFFTEDVEFAGLDFDLVLASGALQYVEDWKGTLRRLVAASRKYVYLTRVPTTQHDSYVMIQRGQSYGYDTAYLSWTFQRDELLAALKSMGLVLMREFLGGEQLTVHGREEPCVFNGYLLARQ